MSWRFIFRISPSFWPRKVKGAQLLWFSLRRSSRELKDENALQLCAVIACLLYTPASLLFTLTRADVNLMTGCPRLCYNLSFWELSFVVEVLSNLHFILLQLNVVGKNHYSRIEKEILSHVQSPKSHLVVSLSDRLGHHQWCLDDSSVNHQGIIVVEWVPVTVSTLKQVVIIVSLCVSWNTGLQTLSTFLFVFVSFVPIFF